MQYRYVFRLFIVVVTSVWPFLASAKTPIYLDKETFTSPQTAVVQDRSGRAYRGTISMLYDDGIKFSYKRRGRTFVRKITYSNISRIQIGRYVYKNTGGRFHSKLAAQEEETRKKAATEAKFRGQVKVVNNTDKEVEFVITRHRNQQGNDVVLDNGRSKSNLENIARALDSALNKGRNNSPKPMRWKIDPKQTSYLVSKGEKVITSKVHYTLVTADGSKRWQIEKKREGRDFVITIDKSDLHSPVLVNTGRWNLDQGIWYTTHKARTPTTIHPVKGFFSGKIEHYEVRGGEEYKYTKEKRAGHATAWAEIENPTTKTITVTVTLEFHFTHLLLSNERVNASITIKPKTKTKMYITVNTLALIGNRKANSVRQIDIQTTVK